MRHLLLGLTAVAAFGSLGCDASAQNYIPARDYSGPGIIVNMDVIANGGAPVMPAPFAPYSAPVYGAPMALAPVPVLSMPLAPPPMPSQRMAMHTPPSLPPIQDDMQSDTMLDAPIPDLPPAMPSPVAAAIDTDLPPPMMAQRSPVMAPKPMLRPALLDRPMVTTDVLPKVMPASQTSAPSLMPPVIPTGQSAKRMASNPAPTEIKTAMLEQPAEIKGDHLVPPPVNLLTEIHTDELPPAMPVPVMPVSDVKPIAAAPVSSVAAIEPIKNADDFEAYRLLFDNNSDALKESEKRVLDKVVTKLKQDATMHLQMRAYANGTPDSAAQSRRLSLTRAMNVRRYLLEKGVDSTRVDVRAMGMGSVAMGDNISNGKAPADRVDVIFARG